MNPSLASPWGQALHMLQTTTPFPTRSAFADDLRICKGCGIKFVPLHDAAQYHNRLCAKQAEYKRRKEAGK